MVPCKSSWTNRVSPGFRLNVRGSRRTLAAFERTPAMEELATEPLLMLLMGVGIYWVVYSGVLFALMKMQGWHIGVLPLLGSTALSSALAQIPIIGPFIATGVLAVCVWKASGSDFTDSIFSVVIAGAVMFAFQMFLLTALMGEIQVPWRSEEDETEVFDPDAILEMPAANSWRGPKGDDEVLLYLKGITLSSNQTMALVGSGTSYYSFTNGERAVIRSPNGRLAALCEAISTNETVMQVELNGRTYRLTLLLPSSE
jgi:hypothetical protein